MKWGKKRENRVITGGMGQKTREWGENNEMGQKNRQNGVKKKGGMGQRTEQ